MEASTITPAMHKDAFLFNAIAEIADNNAASGTLAEKLYNHIVKRDGSCPYSRQEIEIWINDLDCLE